MEFLAGIAALMACAGSILALAGWLELRRVPASTPPPRAALPPVSVLKPLYGGEPLLEEALASVCAQRYPRFQVVFGVQRPDDAALAAVARVRARFPDCDIAVVVDDTADGANRKVANLINMLPAARYDVLVIADSDMHVAPDYLERIATALAEPGIGLVTTMYSGLPASGGAAAALAATGITHLFLPGTAIARRLGRQDCLGATMALRRETLAAVGGLQSLVEHLADDQILGRKVRQQGLAVAMATTIPMTTVPEATLGAVFRHELRWARTIRSLAPVQFALSAVQYPLAWALLCMVLTGGEEWAVAVYLAAWACRAAAARGIDATLARLRRHGGPPAPLWLLPLRDVMSIAVLLASFGGDTVEWRGRVMRTGGATTGYSLPPAPSAT
jgi:ceramide glucosyltransferase